jgi:hypothetical protein
VILAELKEIEARSSPDISTNAKAPDRRSGAFLFLLSKARAG